MVELKNHLAFKRALDELNVVVVDDSKFTHMLIRTILQPLRLKKMRFFETAESALLDMKEDVPNLLIADWNICDASGNRLLEIVRRAEEGRLACVSALVTISCPTRQDAQDAVRCGAHAVVAKPFSPQSLQRRVQWILRDMRKMKPFGEHLILEDAKGFQAKPKAPKAAAEKKQDVKNTEETKTAAA